MPTISRAAAVFAAIALIVFPLIAVAMKFANAGWMLVFIFMISPLLAAGYIMQLIMAITGFLTPRAFFLTGTQGRLAIWASWTGAVAVVLTVFFLPEGGDSLESLGSIFQHMIGSGGDVAMADLTSILALYFAVIWIAAWFWLLILWNRARPNRGAKERGVKA